MRLLPWVPVAAALPALLSLPACAGGPRPSFRERPGEVEVRGYAYTDNSGLTVSTIAADIEQPVARRWTAHGRGVVDSIRVERKQLDPGDPNAGSQPTGHRHADVVTSASAVKTGGGAVEEVRVEGTLGARTDTEIEGRPTSAGAELKASTEPDYSSLSASLRASTELAERNLTVAVFAGYGRDTVSPDEPPPGERAAWPATHDRINGGVSVTQLLSPRLTLSAGAAASHQWGTLESPYRRALVRTSLFPEAVPGSRDRFTAFTAVSAYLGAGAALHVRQGFYIDTWSVAAWIPEVALAWGAFRGGLVTARYRMYTQSEAWFYKARYEAVEPVRTGDTRLGPMLEHSGGLCAAWTFLGERGGFGAATGEIGYDASFLTYEAIDTDVIVAHIVTAALSVSY